MGMFGFGNKIARVTSLPRHGRASLPPRSVVRVMRAMMRAALPALALLAATGTGVLAQQPAPLRLELNRLETVGNGCRIYLVVGNDGPAALDSLKLDLVLFGQDGVIDRRLAVEAGPLRAAKTSVKLFDLADFPCERLGSVLLNDVLACQPATAEDCFARIVLTTRTPAGFTK